MLTNFIVIYNLMHLLHARHSILSLVGQISSVFKELTGSRTCARKEEGPPEAVGWVLGVLGRESEMEVQRGPGTWRGVPGANTH